MAGDMPDIKEGGKTTKPKKAPRKVIMNVQKGKERTYSTPIGDLPSVTTVLGIINKPWMVAWVLKMAREASAKAIIKLKDAGTLMDMDEATLEDVFKESNKSYEGVAKEATDLGSLLHGAVEFYYKERHDYLPEDFAMFLGEMYGELFGNMVRAFFELLIKNKLTVLLSEHTVYSTHGYAGTLDLTLKYEDTGAVFVTDIKTTKKERFREGVPSDIAMQLTAYKKAALEMGLLPVGVPYGRAVMRIDKINPLKDSSFITLGTDEMEDWTGFLNLLKHYQYIKIYNK